MRLERRKVHFPDSLAAKVLDLIYVSPNRIPCRDLDLETELPGERQPSGHHLLAWTVAETAQFCSLSQNQTFLWRDLGEEKHLWPDLTKLNNCGDGADRFVG